MSEARRERRIKKPPYKPAPKDMWFSKCTQEERTKLLMCTLSGHWNYRENIVMYGSESFKRIKEYEQHLKDKYS